MKSLATATQSSGSHIFPYRHTPVGNRQAPLETTVRTMKPGTENILVLLLTAWFSQDKNESPRQKMKLPETVGAKVVNHQSYPS